MFPLPPPHHGSTMIRTTPTAAGRACTRPGIASSTWALLVLVLPWCWSLGTALKLAAADIHAVAAAADTNGEPRFAVQSYTVAGKALPSAENLTALLARHTGTNVDIGEIVRAAAELQLEYQRQG